MKSEVLNPHITVHGGREYLGPFELGKVHHADCLEALRLLPDKSVDCVITDPPYGLNSRMNGGTWGIKYGKSSMLEWDFVVPIESMLSLIEKGKNTIIWGGNYYSFPASRCWLIWEKPKLTTISDAELAWTNFDKLTKSIYLNRVSCEKGHPTEKPIELMLWCVKNYTNGGGLVLDPFSGSGTTGVACVQLGRRFLGFEIDAGYCKLANDRIAAAHRGQTLTQFRQGQEILDFGDDKCE